MLPPPGGDALPDGIWEPMPGESVASASVAADGATLWWAVAKREPIIGSVYSNWLLATQTTGEELVAPTEITPDNPSGYHPDLVVTPSAIVAKVDGIDLLMRRYDRAGTALGTPFPVDIDAAYTNYNTVALTATASGAVQLVATLQADAAEVAIVDIDATGVVGATHTAGTPDPTDGGTTAWSVSAAARPDGSTLLAWDRGFNACISTRPASTLTTVFDGANVGPIESVRDLPDSEMRPMIAATGDAAFVAWIDSAENGSRIELARYPDVTTVLAEAASDSSGAFGEMRFVLSSPDRGAIAYRQNPGPGIYVRSFEDRAGTLVLGTPHLVPLVETDKYPWLTGLVPVGNDRYVVAWIEEGAFASNDEAHLYATELDLAGEQMRPAPPAPRDPTVQPRPRRLRCP